MGSFILYEIANGAIITEYIATIIAVSIAVCTCFVSFFWSPHRYLTLFSTLSFISMLIAAGSLVFVTMAAPLPFLAWALLVMFAPLFGAWGVVPAFFATIGYAAWIAMGSSTPSYHIPLAIAAGIMPFLAGGIIWGRQDTGKETTEDDRSFTELRAELNSVANKSEVVINAIADGLVALDGRGIIQIYNPAAQRLLGWERRDTIGLSYKSVIKLIDAKNEPLTDQIDPIYLALTSNTRSQTETFSLQTQSGKSFLAALSVSPINQVGSGIIVAFRDITREKSEELQRAEFISTASHEMRTPVASIEGYLGLALNPQTAQIDDRARDYVTKAHASAEHLGRLFQDLLDVSKADDGRLKNNPSVIDVIPFIKDIVTMFSASAAEKQLVMIYKPSPSDNPDDKTFNPILYANIDNDHLREIVSNLVENAIKYTPSGQVIIDVVATGSKITISVADTGIGIPREDQAHLFQKFYRIDSSDTREIGGTGLGLYLCRRLSETIGGRLWVESEYQKGSTFSLEIPRLSNEEATRMIEQSVLNAEREAARQSQPPATAPQPQTLPSVNLPNDAPRATTPIAIPPRQ